MFDDKSEPPTKALEDFILPSRRERIDRVVKARTRSLTLVLDQVANAHNISAVMRSADAFGIQELYLIGSEFSFSEGISLGAERWLDLHKFESSVDALAALKKNGFTLVTLEAPPLSGETGQSVPVFRLPFEKKLALVFGNEHRGISAELRNACDLRAYIPMLGFVESFNISVAAAITMFCSLLGEVEGVRKLETLSSAEEQFLREDWIKKSLRSGDAVSAELERRATAQKRES